MKMDKINELIKEHGWSLLSWQERYGGEVWIAIAPTRNHVDVLEDMNTDGDAESLTLTDYLFEISCAKRSFLSKREEQKRLGESAIPRNDRKSDFRVDSDWIYRSDGRERE